MADEEAPKRQSGVAVDASGGPVVDPTKNVEDLVRALEAKLSELRETDGRYFDLRFATQETSNSFAREAESKFQNFARDAEAKFSSSLTAAETRRIDQLAETRQEFQNTIRDMLAESVRTTSSLVSTQLVQIQATFDARVTKLEQAQLTQAGRSSVADPALESALMRLSSTIAAMQDRENTTGGQTKGSMDATARMWIMLAVMAAIAGPAVAVVALFHR
jgi:DNA anti-recombination protein RmuC